MKEISRIVNDPILLIAPRTFIFPDNTCEEMYQEALVRYAQRYDLLKSNCTVKIVGSTQDNEHSHKFYRFTEDFEKLRPGSTIRVEVNEYSDFLATIWPRDVFQIYKDLVFSTPTYEKRTATVLSKLGIPVREQDIISSNLGQGGYIVGDNKLLILSEVVSQDEHIPKLRERGYQIYFLPVPEKEDRSSDIKTRMSLNQHIDTEFNIAFSPQGNPLICVNEAYYKLFKPKVDYITKLIDARMHIVPENSLDNNRGAINFIKLQNGKIMLPNYCHQTQTFLEKGLGKDKILVAKIDIFNDYSGVGGGLRCMSNLIE